MEPLQEHVEAHLVAVETEVQDQVVIPLVTLVPHIPPYGRSGSRLTLPALFEDGVSIFVWRPNLQCRSFCGFL